LRKQKQVIATVMYVLNTPGQSDKHSIGQSRRNKPVHLGTSLDFLYCMHKTTQAWCCNIIAMIINKTDDIQDDSSVLSHHGGGSTSQICPANGHCSVLKPPSYSISRVNSQHSHFIFIWSFPWRSNIFPRWSTVILKRFPRLVVWFRFCHSL